MATTLEQVDEASLAKRLEEQKQLVARLVSEGKDASDANVTLYAPRQSSRGYPAQIPRRIHRPIKPRCRHLSNRRKNNGSPPDVGSCRCHPRKAPVLQLLR